ncbi:DUF3152 domain-containing protein [Streptomyces sp. NBC_00576]|uniref:DUF3152 domain-containing protein n=1 Tax=Streptomyces sp. NBC_00576 TaxID=2903665 RepID=UPI002E80563A|nr:DUF3152 domain-containing protein [Streptomyces sp. NBC_00576]WUB71239.1 DUF3152 domain-containing protein [Streptomyces sp. NBC_00576]
MGRHSRRGRTDGSASTGNTENIPVVQQGRQPQQGQAQGPNQGQRRQEAPRFPVPDGTPAHGFPRFSEGAPAHGMPRFPEGTPAHGFPRVRGGGHPEQRESGGGWGEFGGQAGVGPAIPRQRPAPPNAHGPRQAYVDAFDAAGRPGAAVGDADLFAPRARTPHPADTPETADAYVPPAEVAVKGKGGKGRAFTGIAAAAVTTVLAVVVAGQVTKGEDDGGGVRTQTARGSGQDVQGSGDSAARSDGLPAAPGAPDAVTTLTYDQKMAKTYALGAALKGSGKFDAIRGFAKAPGAGQKYTYRVDVEQGLGLDGELFAQAVQKTLNDDRSWAHNGGRTFERISSGKPDFVITLASPGTTAFWCAKSGLDTTEDNVSCNSTATDRVMINAYRWAQGSETYGDKIYAYRQMLINHEVGHRLGYGHVTCDKDGELAPVMQQQTKFLDHNGIHCRANPWPYPGS